MISQMRRRSRLIMFIVAISFVVGFGLLSLGGILDVIKSVTSGEHDRPRQPDELGRVGKRIITNTEYQNLKNYLKWLYVDDTRARNISGTTEEEFAQQAWAQLVSDRNFEQLYKDLRIEILPDEVIEILRMAPPRDIVNDSSLFTDGKFDQNKYQQILYTQRFLARYFMPYRDFIRNARLESDFDLIHRVTEAEVKDAQTWENTRFTIALAAFEPVYFVKPPPDHEIWAYYRGHTREFARPERRALKVAVFPLHLGPEDTAAAKSQIDDVFSSLESDEDFTYQTDIANDSTGRWFKIDSLDSMIWAAVRLIEPGKHTPPVLTTRGYQIARLEERSGDSLRLRFITVPIEMNAATYGIMREKVDNLVGRVRAGEDLDSVARELQGHTRDLPPLEKGKPYDAEAELAGSIEAFARRARPGDLSEPMRSEKGYIYVVQMTGIHHGLISAFDSSETKQKIAAKLMKTRAMPEMRERARRTLMEARAGKTLLELAKADTQIRYQRRERTPIGTFLRNNGPEFAGALLTLRQGELSDIITTERGLYIIYCEERIEEPEPLVASSYMIQSRRNAVQNRIRTMLRKPAHVIDYRDPFNR